LSKYKAKLHKIRAMSARITTLDFVIFGIAMAGMILAAVEADIFFVSFNSNHLNSNRRMTMNLPQLHISSDH
jgi:hypothetical protein